MPDYHKIMEAALPATEMLAAEHNAVLIAFARSDRLHRAALASLAVKREVATGGAIQAALQIGDPQSIRKLDRMAYEISVLEIITGEKHSVCGYLTFVDAMKSLVP